MSINTQPRALSLLFVLLTAVSASATTQVTTAIDTDNNASTGCTVPSAFGTFTGADQLLITTYNAGTVTSVIREVCSGGTFSGGDTIDSGGWAVGVNGGVNLIETHIPWTSLAAPGPMRLGFIISSGTLSDAVFQRPGGAPIMFPGTLGSGRHHAVMPDGLHTITLDGNGGDWAGVPPIAAAGAATASPALRFLSVSLTESDTDFFLRFDVQSNAHAPTAVDDAFSTLRGSTLTVNAPGVLSNDHDPNSQPLTAVLISGPQHGTLTLNSDGSFTYVNDNSPAPTDSFRYKASNGSADSNTALVTLTIISGTPPSITSANHVTFTVGTAGSFVVTATGNPTPSLSMTGTLPAGVTFNQATGHLSGTPAAGTGRQYQVTFHASNLVGTDSQNFTLTVNEAPSITSANNTTFLVGTAGTFTVTSTGFPVPTFSESGALPPGVTFNTSTHVLSGTPTAPGVFPISFTVTNTLGTNTQNFTLNVNQTPAITSANATTFTVGTAGNFTVTATGFPTPTLGQSGALPSGVTFNTATGVLSGTPAAGTGGTHPISFSATNIAGTANQTFTLTVNEAPSITSANVVDFVAGASSMFTITTTGFPHPGLTETGALPPGMSFTDNLNGTATINGTPSGPTAAYPINVTATNTVNTANQTLTIRVWVAPVAVADSYQAVLNTPLVVIAPGVLGNDATNGATITGNSTPAHGGVALAADGSFTYTPATGYTGPDSFTYTLTNFAGPSTATVSITVFAAPVANNDAYQVARGSTPTIAAPGVLGNDSVNGATIVSYGINGNEQTTIGSPTPTSAGGTIALNADGSFTYTPIASNFVGTDTFKYTLTNPAGTSTGTVTFTVVAPPVANADSYNAVLNTPLTVLAASGVLANDTVNSATITGHTNPANGVLTLNADGSFTYAPANGFTGTDTFTYTITNVAGPSTATVTIVVFAAPVAVNDSYPAAMNTPRSIAAPGVLANDSLNAGSIVSYGATSGTEQTTIGSATPTSAGGTIVLNANGSFLYTPLITFTGTDTFKYVLQNPAGSSTATVTFTVFAAPVAVGDNYTVPSNASSTIPAPGVLANDTVNGATITGHTNPAHGTLTLNANGSFTYVTAGYTGPDSFDYTLGNFAGTSTATVNLTVIPPPVTVDDSYNAIMNTPLNVVAPGVLGNDTTNGGTITGHSTPAHGGVALAADGSFTYTPATGYIGPDSFTYTVTNAAGASTATVSITVWAAPVANADAFQAAKNTPRTVAAPGVLGNDTVNSATIASYGTPNGTEQTSIGTSTPTSAGGTVTLNANGSLTYTPPSAVFTGTDTFKYILSNFAGTSTATVTITVVDPPVAVDDGSYQTFPNTPISPAAPGVMTNDTVNGATVTSYGTPNGTEQTTLGATTPTSQGGTVLMNADGSFTYNPPLNFKGTDTFKYTITNAAGSSSATVTIVVSCPTFVFTPANTLPTATYHVISYSQNISVTGGTGPYTLTLANGTNVPSTFTFTDNGNATATVASANPGVTGVFTFDVKATDSTGCNQTQTFSLTVQPKAVNDDYSAAAGLTDSVGNTEAVAGGFSTPSTPFVSYANGVLANDDAPVGSLSVVTTSVTNAAGTINFNTAGGWDYVPAAGFTGTATFNFIESSNGVQVPSIINIVVTNKVWYVKNNVAGPGTGVSSDPFNTLAQAQTASAAGEIIYVSTGDGLTTGQNAGITLKATQQLIGNGVALVVNGNTLAASGAKPRIGNTAGSAVTLANGNILKGFTATTTTGANLSGISGNALTTGPALDTVDIGPTTGAGFSITNSGTVTSSLTNVAISGASTGISGSTFGTITINSGVTVSGSTALALTTGTINGTFGTVTSTGGTSGISLSAVGGSITIPAGSALSGATTSEFSVSGGSTVSVTYHGNMTFAGSGSAIDVNGHSTGTLTFDTGAIAVTAGTGVVLQTATGTYNFDTTSGTTNVNGATTGASIGSGATGTATFGSGFAINNTTGASFVVSGNVAAHFTYNGNITQGNAALMVSITDFATGGTATFQNGTLNATNGTGISLVNADGSVSFNGTTTLNGGDAAIDISGGTDLVTGSQGTIVFGTGTSITNPSGAVLDIQGSRPNVSYNGSFTKNTAGTGINIQNNKAGLVLTINSGVSPHTLSTSTGTGISISGNTTPSLNFNSGDLSVSTTTGIGIDASGGGTLTFSGASNIINSTLNTALQLNGMALNASSINSVSSGGGTHGISLTNVSGGTLTIGAGSLSGNSGSTFFVSGGSVSVSYNGTMSQTGPQRIVDISGITGGTIALGGTITGSSSCTGITLGGSGGTVTITGGITLNGTADTFSASGSGLTVNVTGINNIGATTAPTGPAVSITNSTIGASNVTFHTVSATGGTNGIVINNTGITGSFIITGGGSVAVGGDNSGGTIQTSTSHGIALTLTKSPSFTNIHVTNTAGSGIKGVLSGSGAQVTNFTLHNSTIDNSNTGGTVDDSNVAFNTVPSANETNVTGTVSITQNVLNTSHYHGVDIQQDNGTISSLDISNNTFTSATSGASSLGSAIRIGLHGTASVVANMTTATINSNTITNFPSGGGIIVQGGNTTSAGAPSGSMGSVTINANQIHGEVGTRMATQGINLSSAGHGTYGFTITNNVVSDTQGVSIAVNSFGQVTGSGVLNNNSITSNSNVNGQPGYNLGSDIQFTSADTPSLIITSMNANSSAATQGNGILGLARGNAILKVNVTNNTIAAPLGGVRPGIRFDSGNGTAGENSTVCVALTGNTSAGSGGTQGIGLRKQGTVTTTNAFGVVGMAATASPGVEAYVNSQNPAGNGTLLISATSGFQNCTIP